MKTGFLKHYEETQKLFESFLGEFWSQRLNEGAPHLREFDGVMSYSLLQEGAKRFRPVLSLLTEELLNGTQEKVLPFAAAVEMIHTFSLVHDDLPCMDNDDERRGKPTNHIKFGEAQALLAGDALLAEAFATIAGTYHDNPETTLGLIHLLATATGRMGMVGGQVIDIGSQLQSMGFDELKDMHARKTGALIRVSVEGACLVNSADEETCRNLRRYGEHLGLAFQLADDLLDSEEETSADEVSFVSCLGKDRTMSYLEEVTEAAIHLLKPFGEKAVHLQDLCRYNCDRSF